MEDESHHIISRTQASDLSLADTISTPMHSGFIHQQFSMSPMNMGHMPHSEAFMMDEADGDDQHDQHCEHHGSHNHNHSHDQHSNGQHNHGGQQHGGHNHNRGPSQRNFSILIFVYILIMGSVLLHIFAFNNIYEGFTWYFAHIANIFIQGMITISYTVTNVSQASKPMTLLGKKNFQPREHLDPIYDLASKQCQKCKNYKFPRVSHCSQCGSCVYKFDHHCIWTQNCIGLNNYRNFFLFVSYSWLGCIQYQYNNWQYFWWCYNQPNGFWMQGTGWFYLYWFSMTIGVIFMTIMIGTLFFGHLLMAITNITTLQSIKSKSCCIIPFFEWRKPYLSQINLFDRGEAKNIINILGSSLLTCWFPYPKEMQNDILPEKMNPQPTRTQILQWDEKMRKAEFERQYNIKNLVSSVQAVMKGKKIKINGEVITL